MELVVENRLNFHLEVAAVVAELQDPRVQNCYYCLVLKAVLVGLPDDCSENCYCYYSREFMGKKLVKWSGFVLFLRDDVTLNDQASVS